MTKPSILPPRVDAIPCELAARPQWVAWRLAYRSEKWTKIPVCPRTGGNAAVDQPATWSTFADAVSYWQAGRADGIGYVLTSDDPIVAVDLDKCVVAGIADPWAAEIIARLASYTELSPSGSGIRILCRGTLPPGRRRKGSVGMYCDGRYVTITGHRLTDARPTIEDRTTELAALHADVFAEPERPLSPRQPSGTGLTAADDHELIERAKAAANGVRFTQLWSGDTSGYSSASEADLALVNVLAFWTGPDPERIDRLFRASGLCRQKWTERADYRERTITTALQRGEFYGPGQSSRRTLPATRYHGCGHHRAVPAARYGLPTVHISAMGGAL